MNKTHRIIWNKAKGIYQVASEKTRTAGKAKSTVLATATLGVVLSAFTTSAMATQLPDWKKLTGTQTIAGGDYENTSSGANIGIFKGADITVNDDLSLTWQIGKYSRDRNVIWDTMGISSTYGDKNGVGGTFTANGNVKVVYNTIADNDKDGGGRIAIGSLWGSTFTFNKNLDIKSTLTSSPDSTQHYGIFAGSGPNQTDKLGASTFSTTHVKGDVNIDMSMPQSRSPDNTIVGIRSVQVTSKRGDEYSSGSVVIDGKTSIKMDGTGAQGIYVSGGQSNVTLNDAKIVMNNGMYGSAAIKIGKVRGTGTGPGTVTIKGAADINTENSDGAAIQVYNSNSSYIQNADTSSSKIRSKVAALEVGALDWIDSSAGTGNKVLAHNADWSNKKGSLMLVGKSSTGDTTHGQEATLTFTGAKTNLKAADDGYALDVNGLGSKEIPPTTIFGFTIPGQPAASPIGRSFIICMN